MKRKKKWRERKIERKTEIRDKRNKNLAITIVHKRVDDPIQGGPPQKPLLRTIYKCKEINKITN